MKKLAALLFAALLLMGNAFAAMNVVSPSEDFYVLDNADVLTYDTRATIVYSNDDLYDACGAQIVVVTVPTTGSYAIDDYAYEVLNQWGVGSAENNNGMVLLLAIDDDNYYLAMGTGLEKKVSAATLQGWLDDYLEPYFAKQQYDEGVRAVFEKMFYETAELYSANVALYSGTSAESPVTGNSYETPATGTSVGTPEPVPFFPPEDEGHPVLGFIILLVIIFLIWRPRRKRRYFFFGPIMPARAPRVRYTRPVPPPPPPRTGFGGPTPPAGPRPTATPFGSAGRGSTAGSTRGSSFGSTRGSSYGGSSFGSRSAGGGSSRGYGAGRSSFGSSSFGSSRSSFGSSSRSSFGSSRSSGGRSGGGFGGGRSGGGGSRGGGAGRH